MTTHALNRPAGLYIARLALLAGLIASACAAPATAAEANFAGKTIRVIVAYSAGGPVDVFGRVIARHLPRQIPGAPAVIVQNMDGAGGNVAANYVYNVAPKDGTAILVTIAPFTNQYLGGRPVKFDTARFYWLGALNISQASYAHKDLGVRSVADLVGIERTVVIGGLNAGAARDLRMRAFLESLGVTSYKHVVGYRGTLQARQALLIGEVNFSDESAVAIAVDLASHVKDGTVIPLVQTGLSRDGKRLRDPQIPTLPIAEDAVVAQKGEAVRRTVVFRALAMVSSMVSLGRAILLPPDVPPEIATTLRAAVGRLNADGEFQADAKKLTGGVAMELIGGAEAERFAAEVARLVRSDPEAVRYLDDKAGDGAR